MTPATENEKSHVDKIYSDEYFFGGGAGYPNYIYEKEILVRHGHFYGKLLSKYISKPHKVLDVGAAAGFILKGLTDYGWKGTGIEVNENMAAYGRETLGLNVQPGTLEGLRSDISFNLICFIQVIAHLLDPVYASKIASNLLVKGGYLLVETWHYESLAARIFGKHWHEYSPPSVLHWFSQKSLDFLMEKYNLELIARGRPKKYISVKHAKSLLLFKLKNSFILRPLDLFFQLIPDGLTIRYPTGDLFWALYSRKK